MTKVTKARVPTHGVRPNPQALERKLLAYSAVAGVVLAATPDVLAQCTGGTLNGTVCVQNVNSNVAGGVVFTDFDGDGNHALRVRGFASTDDIGPGDYGALWSDNDAGTDGMAAFVGNDATYLKILNPTDAPSVYTISAGNKFYNPKMFMFNNGPGDWPVGKRGYAGVRFVRNGNTHYGWVELRHVGGPGAFFVHDIGYETRPNTAIVAGSDGSTLPVELTRFTARAEGNRVVLDWETASEQNNAGFEVQLRRGGSDAFSVHGFVSGRGTTLEAQRYSYAASDLRPGRYTFRLKQVDFDGQFAYSAEVETLIEVPGTHVLDAAYPNPFNPSTKIELMVAAQQHVRLEVFDVRGQHVATLHDGVLAEEVSHQFVFDAGALPSGTYIYRATGEHFQESKRVLLVK